MKSSFRIAHGQPEWIPSVGIVPPGPIHVFPSDASFARVRDRAARRSRKGVQYSAVEGHRLRVPEPVGTTADGAQRLKTSDGSVYLQRHGTFYRA